MTIATLLIGFAFGVLLNPLWRFCRWLAKPDAKPAEAPVEPPLGELLDEAIAEGFIKEVQGFYARREDLISKMRGERARYEKKGDAVSMYRADQLGTAMYHIGTSDYNSRHVYEALGNLKRK